MNPSRWQSSVLDSPTLTVLNRDGLFHCLSFLTDDELWHASMTCYWFRTAFFQLARESNSCIFNFGTRGYHFPRVTRLTMYNNHSMRRLGSIDFYRQFPRLTKVSITPSQFDPINLESWDIPEIRSIKVLILHNCEFHGHRSWPFPAVQVLDAFNSALSLPEKLNLDTLILRSGAVISNPIPKSLRELRVFGTRVPEIDPLESSLKRLEIYHPIAWNGYHTYSSRAIHSSLPALPSLTELKMEIYNPAVILRSAGVLFPNLTSVSLERAAFSRLDLALISPHPNLECLISNQNRILGLQHLTPENFPRLKSIRFTGELAELSPLPENENLTSLTVSLGYSKGLKTINRSKFPNLIISEKPVDNLNDVEEMESW